MPTIESLGLTALPLDHQFIIAHVLLDHASKMCKPCLTDELRAELRRRVADIETNPDDEIPWEELRENIRVPSNLNA